MAITKLQAEGLNLADTFAFTGTVSGAGESNTPYFLGRLNANQDVSNGSGTVIQLTAAIDSASGYTAGSDYKWTVPSGQAGKYFIALGINGGNSTNNSVAWVNTEILKNASTTLSFSDNKTGTSTAITHHIKNNYCSALADLSVGDYIRWKGTVYSSAGTGRFIGNSSALGTYGILYKVSSS